MPNKVKFGLSNVNIAKITKGENNSITYGSPFALPGAVTLTIDPAGESADFFADNTKYFSDSANQGYSGTLEIAKVIDTFREQILGQIRDNNGAFFENKDDVISDFALGCQFEGDTSGTRYWFYQVSVQRPSISSQTIENSKTPATDSLNITITPRISDGQVLTSLEKSDSNTSAYNGFFAQVYEKVISA